MNKCTCPNKSWCLDCKEVLHQDGCPKCEEHVCPYKWGTTKEAQHDANVIKIFNILCSLGYLSAPPIEDVWEKARKYAEDLNSSNG